MTLVYKKLDIDLSFLVKDIIFDTKTLELKHFEEYLTNVNMDDINGVLYDRFNINIFPRWTNLTKISPPGVGVHTDAFNATINIYINAKNSVTTFYKEVEANSSTVFNKQDSNNNSFNIKTFDKDKLEEITSLKTKAGECYLFNTSVPHSVYIPLEDDDRLIFRIIWDSKYTFEEVYNDFHTSSNNQFL